MNKNIALCTMISLCFVPVSILFRIFFLRNDKIQVKEIKTFIKKKYLRKFQNHKQSRYTDEVRCQQDL